MININGVLVPKLIEDSTPDYFQRAVSSLPDKERAITMKRERFLRKVQEINNGHGDPL